jgi:23S rRNA (cytosine1962-C5)-methyltransferase
MKFFRRAHGILEDSGWIGRAIRGMALPVTMEELAWAAVARRDGIRRGDSDALRLIDAAGDGLPGVVLEEFAGRWLISTVDAKPFPAWLLPWLRVSGRACYHKRLDQHQKESPRWLCGPTVEGVFPIRECGVVYEASFSSGYSQGIFLDQRDNRRELRGRVGQGMRVLNTFAYTGAFSVCGALGGAQTTTLDLSQPYLDWARRNFELNGIAQDAHHFCKGDTFHWLRRFGKQGRQFDGVVLDPPTFSRDDKGTVFRVERDFGDLVALAAKVVVPGGWILCCTNFRKMTHREFERQLMEKTPGRFMAAHRAMPEDFVDVPYLKSVWLES